MSTYFRDATADALEATTEHVRDNLAASADPNDDPTTYRDRVRITTTTIEDGRFRVTGTLDEPERAPYLAPGYDPLDTATQPPRYSLDGPLPGYDAAPIDQQATTGWAEVDR